MGQVLPEIKRRREDAARFLLPDDQQQHTGYVYSGRADQQSGYTEYRHHHCDYQELYRYRHSHFAR